MHNPCMIIYLQETWKFATPLVFVPKVLIEYSCKIALSFSEHTYITSYIFRVERDASNLFSTLFINYNIIDI